MKSLILGVLALFICSCHQYTVENGKCYDISQVCVLSHQDVITQIYPCGNNMTCPYTTFIETCDKYEQVKTEVALSDCE